VKEEKEKINKRESLIRSTYHSTMVPASARPNDARGSCACPPALDHTHNRETNVPVNQIDRILITQPLHVLDHSYWC
jgi:hypothetical protein